jgi:TPP-dependent pyruvate/acetoin dehydrogenase alpha subunit
MNLASVWSLPVVFVAENNGYGEFMSQKDHMRIENIADRASGYDMPAEIVDGNDVIAVFTAASKAVRRVRGGKGPAMIECKTFRIAGHFVGDPESYRDKQTVKNWQKPDKDPILRFEKILLEKKISTKSRIKKIKQDVYAEIERSVEFAKSCPEPNTEDLLEDVYAD